MVMKRHSYKKNYNIKNKRKSKINGGRPPVEDNDQCRVIATLGWEKGGHSEWVTSVAFHPILPFLATGSGDKTAKLWRFSADCSLVTCVASLHGKHGHRSYVNSVAFHPTLPLLATGSWDETAKLWRFNPHGSASDNMSATCVATMEGRHGHTGAVTSVAFHSKLPLLATGSYDTRAKLWRFDLDGLARGDMSETYVATLGGWGPPDGHDHYVSSVAFHPMLPLLATGSWDTTAKLWSFDPSGSEDNNMLATCVANLVSPGKHFFEAISVVFHPSLPLLATTSWDDTAKLWSFNPHGTKAANMSATCVATLGGWGRPDGRDKWVTSVAFHPKLPLLATGNSDITAKLWRCKMLELPYTYNDFTLYRKKGDISEDICNSLCYLCNFKCEKLCKKNSSNHNNSNGYVVKLTNIPDLPSSRLTRESLLAMTQKGVAEAATARANVVPAAACVAAVMECGVVPTDFHNWSDKNLQDDFADAKYFQDNTGHMESVIQALLDMKAEADTYKDIHVHYNCLHYQLTTNNTEIDNIPISSGTIQRILNIDDKMDALIGTDFYN